MHGNFYPMRRSSTGSLMRPRPGPGPSPPVCLLQQADDRRFDMLKGSAPNLLLGFIVLMQRRGRLPLQQRAAAPGGNAEERLLALADALMRPIDKLGSWHHFNYAVELCTAQVGTACAASRMPLCAASNSMYRGHAGPVPHVKAHPAVCTHPCVPQPYGGPGRPSQRRRGRSF